VDMVIYLGATKEVKSIKQNKIKIEIIIIITLYVFIYLFTFKPLI
jgi:hypothetical protein